MLFWPQKAVHLLTNMVSSLLDRDGLVSTSCKIIFAHYYSNNTDYR